MCSSYFLFLRMKQHTTQRRLCGASKLAPLKEVPNILEEEKAIENHAEKRERERERERERKRREKRREEKRKGEEEKGEKERVRGEETRKKI